MDANHEIIIPNKGLPFKMFIFEGKNGNYVRNKHWHTSIEIFAVFKGSVRFFLNDEEYYLKEGEFVIVNSNEVHSIFAPDLNLTLVIQIPLVVFEEYYIEKNFITFSHDSNYCDKDMMGIMKEMYRAYVAKKCGYEFLTQTKFYHLLYLMVTVYRITDVSDERIKSYKHLNRLTDITNYIKENYEGDISLESLAKIFGYSPTYLSKMFQKYAKVSYREYLQSIRMKRTFCSQFIDTDNKGYEKKITKMVDLFEQANIQYTIAPFFYENNKNPKVSVIEKYFEEIVDRNFWGYITDCRIEKVFENDNEFVLEITTQLSDILIRGVRELPYNIDISSIELNLSNNKVSDDCLWKTFLNQTLKARHNVAHGISFDNTMSIEEIKNTREKIVILEKLFAVLIFKYGIK